MCWCNSDAVILKWANHFVRRRWPCSFLRVLESLISLLMFTKVLSMVPIWAWIMFVLIASLAFIPIILLVFGLGFWISVFALYFAWQKGSVFYLNRSFFVCGFVVCVVVWLWVCLPAFGALVSPYAMRAFEKLLLYVMLIGATSVAAVPALFLCGLGKR